MRPKKEDVDDDGEDDEDLDDDDADGKDLGNGIDSCWWLRSFPACNASPLHCLALDTTMMTSTTMRTKLQTVRCTDYCYAYNTVQTLPLPLQIKRSHNTCSSTTPC